MKVLQVHKYFYPHAGSETALFQTRELLQDHGHEVIDFAMKAPQNVESAWSGHFSRFRDYNDGHRPLRSRAADAVASVYSPEAGRAMRGLLDATAPDIAHLHLIYHQLTFAVVDALYARHVPMVMTLHDYIVGCPAHTLFRDGRVCRDCVSGAPENAVRYRCVKGSLAGSILGAAEARLARLRRSWDKIDVLVCPSQYAGAVAVESGFPEDRVRVLPNFLVDDELGQPRERAPDTPRFFFAGRMEKIKGVETMLDAFSSDPTLGVLRIAGAGGELEAAVADAAERHSNIEYLGRISREQVATELRAATAALLVPTWAENNPMSVLEARAAGVPVITTAVGGLPEMVTDGVDGLIVTPGDPEELANALRRLAVDADLGARMGRAGYERLLRDNTSHVHYEGLVGAYDLARSRHLNQTERPQ